jgi:hypothetical protein
MMVRRMVTGLFREIDSAERAYRAAIERGYLKSEINVVMSDQTRDRYFPRSLKVETGLADQAEAGTGQTKGSAAELGGPVGGTVGTIAPAVAAVGAALLIPGLVIAGPVAIALAAAGAVGVAGGLIGALADWGVPQGRMEEYAEGIRQGGILLGVKTHSDEDARYFAQRWTAEGGELVHS